MLTVAQQRASSPVLVHVHVPKCGGTSLNLLLERWFGEGFEYWHSGLPEHVRSVPEMEAFVAARPSLRCFGSHEVREFPPTLAGRPTLYFTFLREPADRLVSCAKHLLRERAELSPDHDRYLPEEDATPDVPSVLRSWIATAVGPNRKAHVEASSLARFFFHASWAKLEPLRRVTLTSTKFAGEEEDDRLALGLALTELRRFFFVGDFAHFQRDVGRLAGSLRRLGVAAELGDLPHERRSTGNAFASEAQEAELRRELRAVQPIDVTLYESLRTWNAT